MRILPPRPLEKVEIGYSDVYGDIPKDTYYIQAYCNINTDITLYGYGFKYESITFNVEAILEGRRICPLFVKHYYNCDIEKVKKEVKEKLEEYKIDFANKNILRERFTKIIVPYFDSVKNAMTWLGSQDNTIFIGQTVGCPGTFMYPTLEGVPQNKRLEFPVNESFQMQFALGLAIAGEVVVNQYPRQNFLLLSVGDMVNMVDKFQELNKNKIVPRMIIRTASGPSKPTFPGIQHVGNYAMELKLMCKNIKVKEVRDSSEAISVYKDAYNYNGITLVVEHGDSYAGN